MKWNRRRGGAANPDVRTPDRKTGSLLRNGADPPQGNGRDQWRILHNERNIKGFAVCPREPQQRTSRPEAVGIMLDSETRQVCDTLMDRIVQLRGSL